MLDLHSSCLYTHQLTEKMFWHEHSLAAWSQSTTLKQKISEQHIQLILALQALLKLRLPC